MTHCLKKKNNDTSQISNIIRTGSEFFRRRLEWTNKHWHTNTVTSILSVTKPVHWFGQKETEKRKKKDGNQSTKKNDQLKRKSMNESWQEVAEEKHSEIAHGNNLPQKHFSSWKATTNTRKERNWQTSFHTRVPVYTFLSQTLSKRNFSPSCGETSARPSKTNAGH